MRMNTYLFFNGGCEAAFKFYEQCLGGRVGDIFRYGGSPLAGQVPPNWSEKVMHGSVTIGDQVLMGVDVADGYEQPRGVSLSLQIPGVADAERIFHALAQDGSVVLALEKTFWAERFGMVVDRFGIPWQINCESTDQPT